MGAVGIWDALSKLSPAITHTTAQFPVLPAKGSKYIRWRRTFLRHLHLQR